MNPKHVAAIRNCRLNLVYCPYCATAFVPLLKETIEELQAAADEHNRRYKHPSFKAYRVDSGTFGEDVRSGEGWVRHTTLVRKSEFMGSKKELC